MVDQSSSDGIGCLGLSLLHPMMENRDLGCFEESLEHHLFGLSSELCHSRPDSIYLWEGISGRGQT